MGRLFILTECPHSRRYGASARRFILFRGVCPTFPLVAGRSLRRCQWAAVVVVRVLGTNTTTLATMRTTTGIAA
jgi:hypothetical protein